MNKKSNIISVLIVIVIICVLGFLNLNYDIGASDEDYYILVDSEKNVVTLKEKPTKVAVLHSSFAEIWIEAGGEILVTVGESVEKGICKSDVLLVDDGSGQRIDNEALLSYEPDFVILNADIEAQKETAEILRKADIPVAQLRIESSEDYLDILRMCEDINGKTDSD